VGVKPEELEQVRPRLAGFAAKMVGGLARADQRATGELYLRGLMLDGKRKSMQPMAERLGVDHQQLQQFSHVLHLGSHRCSAQDRVLGR
jgi:SRSO17 transposase